MALFALPITATSTSKHSAETRSVRYKVNLPSRKRKRRSESPLAEVEDSLSDDNLPAASTNPLSLTPAEILQYQLAGLELDEHLPSTRDFPHRRLPATQALTSKKGKDVKGKGRAVDTSDEDNENLDNNIEEENEDKIQNTKPQQGSRLRLQHFRVLVVILHKCLQEGDIKRALRAWTIMLRMQFSGQMLDIRSTGYWAIGAELLAKSEDKPRRAADDSDSNAEEGVHNEGYNGPGREKEWGTKEGRAKAVNYLGSMVLEFPFNKAYWRTISAVDFWPSMLAIEIYGIQYEQKDALRKATAATEDVGSGEESEGSVDEEDSGQMESDDSYAAAERRITKRKHKRDEKSWKKREEIRKSTLAAAQSLAARVDELLSDPLYTTNITISEIRAHIAMYVSDLSVPEMPHEDEDENEERESSPRKSRQLGSRANTEKRLLYRQRLNDYENGKRKREKEIERAKTIVKRIIKIGGNVDDFKDLELATPEEQFHDAEG